jgi:endoglycosylceramidase
MMRSMSRTVPAILAAIAACGIAPPAASAAGAAPLRLQDGTLTDRQGRTVVLHGVNVHYKIPPFLPHDGGGVRTSFTRAEARRLRRWGLNTIRLAISWEGVMPARGQVDRGYLDRVRAMTRMAGQEGLHVLVDMHQDEFSRTYAGNGAPAWAADDDGIPFGPSLGHPQDYLQPAVGRAFTNFYEDEGGIRTEFVRAWTAVATALRDEPAVMGYDLLNEPSCEVGVPPCAVPPSFSPEKEAAARWLVPLYDALIPALRRADPDTPAFYEDFFTAAWGFTDYTVGEAPNPPLRHEDTGLSFHTYCPHPLGIETPCETHERNAMTKALANARRNGAYPLLTEWGATDDVAVLRRVADLADELGVSWQFWSLKTWDDPHPGFGADSLDKDADGWSIIAKDGRVKTDKLRVVARAYPERVAGRSARWSFDVDSGAFRMTWRADRRRDTVVSLPLPVHYPRGYRVTVRGAKVTSRRGAALLRVRGTRGRTATLEVRPR